MTYVYDIYLYVSISIFRSLSISLPPSLSLSPSLYISLCPSLSLPLARAPDVRSHKRPYVGVSQTRTWSR